MTAATVTIAGPSELSGTSLSVAYPAGLAGETQLIIALYRASTTVTFSGWDEEDTQEFEGSKLSLFSRVLTGNVSAGIASGTASASLVKGRAFALNSTGALVAHDTSTNAFSATTHATPTVTAADADSTWISAVATCQWPRTWTAPAGFTEIGDAEASDQRWDIGMGVAKQTVSAGATGSSGDWTPNDEDNIDDGEDSIGLSIILGPEGSVTTGRTDLSATNVTLPYVQWVGFSRAASSVADGGTIACTITVVDQRGRGIPNVSSSLVTITQSLTKFSSSMPTPTDEDGEATITLTATDTGAADLYLTVGGVDSRTLAFTVT